MDTIKEIIWGKPIDPLNPPPTPVFPGKSITLGCNSNLHSSLVQFIENEQMPHEVYNFLLDSCFDACISTFNHKLLLHSEKECLSSCATNFKQNPFVF